jgi:hypothetical protein
VRLAQLNLLLAKARLQARLPGVDDAIQAGLAAFERPREAPGPGSSDDAWQLYAMAMRRALDRGDRDRAFELADRARARTLGPLALDRLPSMRGTENALLADEAVIALNQLDDELVVWLVRRGGTEVVRRPLRMSDGRLLAARFRDEIALSAQAPAAGGALFNEILRPFAQRLTDVRHLIVVPDATYAATPFAGLWDQSTRRFLVETRTLSSVASVASLTRAPRARGARAGYVHLDRSTTADAAFRSWSEAPDGAVIHVSAPASENVEHPYFSRVEFADSSGQPHSGMILMRDMAGRNLSRADTLLLSNIRGDGSLALANGFLAAGVGSVVSAAGVFQDERAAQMFDDLRAALGPETAVADGVSAFQRNVLRQTGHRLGAWSSLMVFGVGR